MTNEESDHCEMEGDNVNPVALVEVPGPSEGWPGLKFTLKTKEL